MTIETLDDWNTVLGYCGCCEMPTCPTPELECQSISITACGFPLPSHEDVPVEDSCKLWFKKTVTFTETQSGAFTTTIGGQPASGTQTRVDIQTTIREAKRVDGECEETVTQSSYSQEIEYEVTIDGETDPFAHYTVSQSTSGDGISCPGTYSYTDILDSANNDSYAINFCPVIDFSIDNTWSYTSYGVFTKSTTDASTDPDTETTINITFEAVSADSVKAELDELSFPDDATGELCYSATEGDPDCEGAITGGTKTRYRWVIPDTFEGSYFKVTWDILEEPDGWDATIDDPDYEPPVPNDPPEPIPQVPDPDAPDRSFVSQDNTWEWAGPGTSDPDSWKSSWYEIDPPTVPGTRRVVNTRFECYRSPYGNKPQVTGEGVTLPDP